jgi:hypothetical protein
VHVCDLRCRLVFHLRFDVACLQQVQHAIAVKPMVRLSATQADLLNVFRAMWLCCCFLQFIDRLGEDSLLRYQQVYGLVRQQSTCNCTSTTTAADFPYLTELPVLAASVVSILQLIEQVHASIMAQLFLLPSVVPQRHSSQAASRTILLCASLLPAALRLCPAWHAECQPTKQP